MYSIPFSLVRRCVYTISLSFEFKHMNEVLQYTDYHFILCTDYRVSKFNGGDGGGGGGGGSGRTASHIHVSAC